MSTTANPILDLETRNRWIRNPLNPNGEIQSLLDATKTLSYNRWSVSIVYGGTIKPAYSHEGNGNLDTGLLEHADATSSLYMMFQGHSRIILEKVTPFRGYELIDSDVTPDNRLDQDGNRIANFRKHTNSQRTLDNITDSMGPFIETPDKIQAMLDFIISKKEEAWEAKEKIMWNERIDNCPKFDVSNPNPAANIFNCITFALETAKAGGVDLYPLFGNLVMIGVRPTEKPPERAFQRALPLELDVANEEPPAQQEIKRPTYISYIGWNTLHHKQGQFLIDEELLKQKVDRINASRKAQNDDFNTFVYLNPIDENYILDKMSPRNIYSLIPVVNVFCGLTSIFKAVFGADEDFLVVKDQILACRLLLFTVGVLEITWIGAVIIHGLASLYFSAKQVRDDPLILI